MPARLSVLIAAVGLLVAACGDTSGVPTGTSTTTGTAPATAEARPTTGRLRGRPAPVLAALCELSPPADVQAPGERFFAGPHGPLHTLADELQQAGERSAAARLLEAKQRVEAGLRASQRPADLDTDLGALIRATRAGLQALNRPAGPCP